MMDLAKTIAKRSTCPRRAVGAVLTDVDGRILAIAHNGVAMSEPHCAEGHACGGEGFASGAGLESCVACHAETNALVFCSDPMKIDALYVTSSPCSLCVRYLLNTSCRRIVYAEPYADQVPLTRWVSSYDRTTIIASSGFYPHRTAYHLSADGKLIGFRP